MFGQKRLSREDLLFKLMFMSYAKIIAFSNEGVYLYRVNDTSFTHRIDVSILKRIVNLYNEILQKYLNVSNYDAEVIDLYFFSALYDRSSIVDREDYEPFHTFIRYYGDLA